MNVALVMLLVITIITLILFNTISIFTLTKWDQTNRITSIPNDNCAEPAFQNLIDISSYPCCVVAGYITAKRYIPSVDLVVSSVAQPYMDVCKGFCSLNGVSASDPTKCVDPEGQTAYSSCLQLTNLPSCETIAMPIAHEGITYFYADSATNAQCQSTQPCGLI